MTYRAPLRFLILAAPRTGSNLLCSLLNAHPAIVCHHGLFNPGGVHCARDRLNSLGGMIERDADPVGFLERIWASGKGSQAIGFKMNLGENPEIVDQLLRTTFVRKILLGRRNRLRTYVSEAIATRTGIWESFDAFEDEEPKSPAIRVTARDILDHAARNAAWYAGLEARIAATRQPWLKTDYEALGEPDEIGRILGYLGVERGPPLAPACRKRGPDRLDTVIANMDRLAATLVGTSLLDDLTARDLPDLRAPTNIS